jgi:uncharacterized protein
VNWKENLIQSPADIRELILQSRRIAVLGIKTEAQADQPAFYVPKYRGQSGSRFAEEPETGQESVWDLSAAVLEI